jgi:hypothetical protein
MGSGPFSEDDLDTLPRLFKFHKQLTLLSQLEGTLHDFSLLLYHHLGKQWGGIEKLQRLKMAHLEGVLPNDYISNTIRCTTVKDRKLLDDWNFDMNA